MSCVCVWNIWKDVKLLTFVVSYFSVSWKQQIAGGQRGLAKLCPAKLFASTPGSTDWSPACTCQIMITCCSGFASDFISILSWHPAKPRTGKSIRFSFHYCTVVAIWNFLWSIEEERAASEWFDSSSKDVERLPSNSFSLLIFQLLVSGFTEVFLHVRCIPHQSCIRMIWFI